MTEDVDIQISEAIAFILKNVDKVKNVVKNSNGNITFIMEE